MKVEAKNLARLIKEKLALKTSAPFYIISSQSELPVQQFIKELKTLVSPLEDHPDIMIVNLNKDENSYKVDSPPIKKFQQFLYYNPLHLDKKIIFFNHADKINDTLSNKLLKTLEELSPNFILFFFVSKLEDLLPTVQSRAIKLSLAEDSLSQDGHLLDSNDAYELINAIRSEKDKLVEHELTKHYLTQQINKTLSQQSFKKNELLLHSLRQFEISQEYNNPLLSRLSLFSDT